MHCVRHEFTGLSVDGGFADYVLVPERSLLRLPDGVEPAEVAPHADAGLTAYHAVRRLAPLAVPGTTAVVIGVGKYRHKLPAADFADADAQSVARYLRSKKVLRPVTPNRPALTGVTGNPGLSG